MLRRQPSPPAFGTPSPSNDYIRFIAKAKEAEAIDDNMQRCLHYPDPPGVHWQRETTDAYCSRRNLSTLSQAEVEKLLNEGNASELETAFRGYLDAQLHDPRHLGMLDAAFFNAKFHVASDRAQALTQSWKKQAPDSAFAFAASGMQYLAAAEAARGDGYARQLTADQIAGMDRLAALARKDLDRAVQLQPAMTPAYYAMIIVGSLSGDVAYMADAAQRGLAADPTSFSIHAAMMERSSPRWTGDPSTQTKLAEQIQPLTGQAPLLRLVSAQAPMEAAECNCLPNPVARLLPAADHGASMGDLRLLANVAYRNDANQLAVILYSEALRFNPVDTDSLRWRAQVLAALGDSQWAIQSIERTAKRNPENLDVALTLALAYRDAGKTVQSEAAFLALLERAPTHSKALAQLGDLYSHEAGQPDKAAAIADKLIASDANNPDGYVIRACVQMDRQLPGSYETIEYFLEHFGDRVDQANPARAMRAYLAKHPKPDYSSPR
jgi:tetratricopeptide (TPR) repeat protein